MSIAEKKWKNLYSVADRELLSATAGCGMASLPVAMQPLVRKRNAIVEFRRSLFDGVLAHDGRRFVIYVRTEPSDIATYRARLEDPADGGKSLPAEVRYTIAHELAHTLFFDMTDTEPRSLVDMDSRTALDRLERLCDEVAAKLLMPEQVVKQAIATHRGDAFDPTVILAVAATFRLPIRAVVLRLKGLHWITDEDGAIFSIKKDEGEPYVESMAISAAMRDLLRRSGRLRPEGGRLALRQLFDLPELLPYGGTLEEARVTLNGVLKGRSRWSHDAIVRCKRIDDTNDAWIVTARLNQIERRQSQVR